MENKGNPKKTKQPEGQAILFFAIGLVPGIYPDAENQPSGDPRPWTTSEFAGEKLGGGAQRQKKLFRVSDKVGEPQNLWVSNHLRETPNRLFLVTLCHWLAFFVGFSNLIHNGSLKKTHAEWLKLLPVLSFTRIAGEVQFATLHIVGPSIKGVRIGNCFGPQTDHPRAMLEVCLMGNHKPMIPSDLFQGPIKNAKEQLESNPG